ncbi:MAG: 6-phosphogluconate dehydrogenase [Altibacter sp.]|uniref:6-phosphogluconate dehydrogenase n=1 Tax=Altibacter sp. TaxID=2024823 RepID=UPI001D2D2C5F|nr:6-phosphogluconate dehydrogenase [Altibacter sp.]MBZ0327062.1 6-phosphogluconate dehydrogenase [Altibacter sp.]
MKKILFIILGSLLVIYLIYFAFVANVTYSEGTRAGELIKFSNKGMLFKTWEGEISQGISGAQIFAFSVLDKEEHVIKKLQEYQGKFVKLTYEERYTTFYFWGDTHYFVTDVSLEESPHFNKN